MESGSQNDWPESLPQQVRRLATTLGRAAYQTRERWTPWICLAVFFVLAIGLRLTHEWAAATAWYAPAIRRLLGFLAGVEGTSVVLAGLGTALTRASLVQRWLGGAGAMVLLTLAESADLLSITPTFDWYFVLELAGKLSVWAIWLTTGFAVRAMSHSVFGPAVETSAPPRLRIGDLMLLTAVVAASFGFNSWWIKLAEADPAANVVVGSGIAALVMTPIALPLMVIPLAPVLIAAFPRGSIRPSLLFFGVGVSIAFAFVANAIYEYLFRWAAGNSLAGLPINKMTILATTVGDLGAIFGVLAIALWLRWAGYRLHRC